MSRVMRGTEDPRALTIPAQSLGLQAKGGSFTTQMPHVYGSYENPEPRPGWHTEYLPGA